MIWAFISVVLLLGLITFYAFREQGRRYEQLIRILETDRDAARNDAKVYRNLLFPVLAKKEVVDEAVSALTPRPVAAVNKKATAQPQPMTVDEVFAMHIPYREKFKLLMRLTNTKQQKRDALASALEKQKPVSQEKENVTTA